MMQLAFFLFALLIPWLLGFVAIKPFLKQRYGYTAFALGAGYLLGWFLTTLILRVYDYFQRPFNIMEIVIIECIIALPLLFVHAKPCAIEEQQLEKVPSNLTYFLTALLVLLLLYRWGLTAVDLLSKPVFPWDGWWQFTDTEMQTASDIRHPYFIPLVQTYNAMAWGNWDDGIVNLPWLGLGISLMLIVFGSLRYLGANALLALLAGYIIISLPIVDAHISLGSYADLWAGAAFFISVSLFVILLTYREWRLLPLLFVFLAISYLTKNTAIIFIFVLCFVLCWYLLGGVFSMFLLLFLGAVVYIGKEWLTSEVIGTLSALLSSSIPDNLLNYNPVAQKVWNEWIILDNWHYIFIAGLFSLFLLFFQKDRNKSGEFILLIIAGFSALVVMLLVTFFTAKISVTNFSAYFNRVSLYFIPIFGVVIISIYHLLFNNDKIVIQKLSSDE